MEAKNNIIRRALEQAPDTQLPEGFCERLMERLERESARRERPILPEKRWGCFPAAWRL